MAFEKLSTVTLCAGVPLDVAHNHTITFANVTAQNSYFLGKGIATAGNVSYQRHGGVVAFPAGYDAISRANYLAFQNSPYSAKWYYGFVTGLHYVNDNVTYVQFELDSYQTYQFDFSVSRAFVEREHVNDDVPGNYLLDEPVALGDYVTTAYTQKMLQDFWLTVGSTVDLKDTVNFPDIGGYVYGRIPSGISYYCFDTDDSTLTMLNAILEALANAGKSDAIVTMFMLPKDIVDSTQSSGGFLKASVLPQTNVTAPNSKTLNGYTPKNKKLLTYPFRALMLTNSEGQTSTLRYELFPNSTPQIALQGGIQPNSRALLYPLNYEGVVTNLDRSIGVGNFPQCSWVKDVYANWMAAQSIRWGYEKERLLVNSVASTVSGAAPAATTGATQGAAAGPAGMAAGAAAGAGTAVLGGLVGGLIDYYNVQSSINEEKELHSIIPNSVQGTIGNGYTNISLNQYGFKLEERTINAEYARVIDDFLSAFGYKVNRLKTPNITGRRNWNYVKCKTIAVSGGAPVEHLERIRQMFINGTTFWHTTDVGNYSLDNSVV